MKHNTSYSYTIFLVISLYSTYVCSQQTITDAQNCTNHYLTIGTQSGPLLADMYQRFDNGDTVNFNDDGSATVTSINGELKEEITADELHEPIVFDKLSPLQNGLALLVLTRNDLLKLVRVEEEEETLKICHTGDDGFFCHIGKYWCSCWYGKILESTCHCGTDDRADGCSV